MSKTFREIEELKSQWEADPHWDLWKTPGFEDHETDLRVWAEMKEAAWKVKAQEQLEKKAEEIGCPGNTKLAEYVLKLEWQIEELYQRFNSL